MDSWGHSASKIEEKGLDERHSFAAANAERKSVLTIERHVVLKSAILRVEVNVSEAVVSYFPSGSEFRHLGKSFATCCVRRYGRNVPGAHHRNFKRHQQTLDQKMCRNSCLFL
jgi:hypothetical protein